MSLIRSTAPLPILVVLLSLATLAQTPTAVVNGTVVDSSGASVPDANVLAINQDTNVVSPKKTAADGTFTIINLLPGNYVVTVEKGGFKKLALPVFKLDVNQTLTVQLQHLADLPHERFGVILLREQSGQRAGVDAAGSAVRTDGERAAV